MSTDVKNDNLSEILELGQNFWKKLKIFTLYMPIVVKIDNFLAKSWIGPKFFD